MSVSRELTSARAERLEGNKGQKSSCEALFGVWEYILALAGWEEKVRL